MSAVTLVECAVCGPVVGCSDQTLVEALATHHERDFGDGHDTDLVVR